MKNLTFEQWMGIIRHGLTAIGGAFVAAGKLEYDQLETIVGAALGFTGLIWSILVKQKADTTSPITDQQ